MKKASNIPNSIEKDRLSKWMNILLGWIVGVIIGVIVLDWISPLI